MHNVSALTLSLQPSLTPFDSKLTNIRVYERMCMDLGSRVKGLRKDFGWSQLDLSKRTAISRGRIAQLETNPVAEVKGDTLVSLAKAFGCTTEELLSDNALGTTSGLKLQPVMRKAPVLNWQNLPDILGGKLMLESKEWVGCPHDIGHEAFALEVQNDLMTSSTGRSYPVGTLIFVEQKRNAKSGDRVIAIDKESKESVFRELVIDGGVRYLKPLNTHYPVKQVTESTHIIGVIVGSYMAE